MTGPGKPLPPPSAPGGSSGATVRPGGSSPAPATAEVERVEAAIARTLQAGAVIAVVLLVIGVALMLAGGISPDSATFPVFDPAQLVGDVVALRAEGFLWAGIVIVILTPIVRLVGETVGFAIGGERGLAAVALGVLAVVAASVAIALLVEG